jgi:DNA-directed RNA polymerase subunit RPC12/RpoP
MAFCPECGTEYESAVVACPQCRAVLVAERPSDGHMLEVVHRVPDAAAGALLCGVLEHEDIPAVLRSATLPGYGSVRRDWSTSAWGEILVHHEDANEARAAIADYLAALERGGEVRDEDVEGSTPG